MKKIVFFLNDWDPLLGYQDNILIKQLLEQNNEVYLIVGKGRVKSQKLSRQSYGDKFFINELSYFFQINDGFYSLKGVSRNLNNIKPDIIIALDGQFDHIQIIKYLKNNSGCRFFLKCHCDDSNSNLRIISKYLIYPFIRRPIFFLLSRYIHRILVVTPKTGIFMEKVYKAKRIKMQLFPMLPKFRFNKDSEIKYKKQIRKELNIEDDAFVIFTGGRLTHLKKTDILLQAVSLITKENIHVIICGKYSDENMEYTSNLRNLVNTVKNVHYLSWIQHSEISNYLYASDISIFCAGQSSLWQDSISLGLPLIVGSGTEISEQDPSYLNEYNSVKIIPRNHVNPDVIKKCILNYYYDEDIMNRMREGSLKYYEKHLDPQKLTRIITDD
tara:strand:+ start:1506 stop:2660 length:1155 start_codon:yes stop_codon:yes gene_type:complete